MQDIRSPTVSFEFEMQSVRYHTGYSARPLIEVCGLLLCMESLRKKIAYQETPSRIAFDPCLAPLHHILEIEEFSVHLGNVFGLLLIPT